MNVKKIVAIFALLSLVASVAMAVEGGNPKKGKYLYKKTCKTCHSEGGEGGKLTPLSKTMRQWDRVFKKEHAGGAAAWEGLSEQDLLDINQFLFDHAADSDQPQTCG